MEAPCNGTPANCVSHSVWPVEVQADRVLVGGKTSPILPDLVPRSHPYNQGEEPAASDVVAFADVVLVNQSPLLGRR